MQNEMSTCKMPLFVDMDGTLVKTDLLVESALQLVKCRPWLILWMLIWLVLGGKMRLKSEIARRTSLPIETLPFQPQLIDYLKEEAQEGRRIVLATAAHRDVAEEVALHMGLFSGVLASDEQVNLKGGEKLKAILSETGPNNFAYAGNARSDLLVWREAAHALVVNPVMGLTSAARSSCAVVEVFDDRPAAWRCWVQATRVYQWMKNLLVFVPVLTSHAFSFDAVWQAICAFLAFGLVASATYIMNDLWDLSSDRMHPRKRRRPFAAGNLPVVHGMLAATGLLFGGVVIAATVSGLFLLVVLAYLAVTMVYSLHLKSYVLIDVILLASLYTIRIIAGAVAINVAMSSWLLAFSIFVFLSLALVKRVSELDAVLESGLESAAGRDYDVADRDILNAMGVAAGYLSVLVLALFIDSSEIQGKYSHSFLLWLLCPCFLYWISRIWLKTKRGEMHDDPLVYSVRDRASWVVLFAMLAITLLAI